MSEERLQEIKDSVDFQYTLAKAKCIDNALLFADEEKELIEEIERLKKELEIEQDISDGMLETIDETTKLIEKDYIYIQHDTYNKLLKILKKEENNESSNINREIN